MASRTWTSQASDGSGDAWAASPDVSPPAEPGAAHALHVPDGPDASELPVADARDADETHAPAAIREARIWAVGGGKGGVGKSVVTTNLAAALAGSGRRCAVIDLDLGGANLHTLLGATRPRYTLSHLLTGDVDSLAELMVQTSVPNLRLVSGHQALLEMANPRYGQKELLLRQIRGVDADEVILDLGAGSAFNVLDFFLLAQRGIVVVTPEPTAIDNAEHFLRAALYRALRDVARRSDVAAAIRRLREDGGGRRVRSAPELIALVRAIDPPAAKPLEERAQTFTPLLIVNQARRPEHQGIGPKLVASCRERLGVRLELAETLDADANVAEAVERGQPTVQAFPLSRFSRQIAALAERLQRLESPAAAAHDATHPADCPCGAPSHGGSAAGARTPSHDARTAALPPVDLAEPGASLRRCREALGFSIAEMAERTRIRILDPIESERFEVLPPEPYLKGYLLEYARELGIPNVTSLVRSYLAKCGAPVEPDAPHAEASAAPSRLRVRRWRD